jgi:hypothetical protein
MHVTSLITIVASVPHSILSPSTSTQQQESPNPKFQNSSKFLLSLLGIGMTFSLIPPLTLSEDIFQQQYTLKISPSF